MKTRSHCIRQQRGSVLIVVLVTLSALLMAATITILKVDRGSKASSQARFQSVALFAAESGVSAGMEFLRANYHPVVHFGALVSPSNTSIQSPLGIPGNMLPALDSGSLFSGDVKMHYEVSLLNNRSDSGFASGVDADSILMLRSVGYGPGTSMVVLEVTIDAQAPGPLKILSWRTIH